MSDASDQTQHPLEDDAPPSHPHRESVDDVLEKSRELAGEGHQIHNLSKPPEQWTTANDPPTEAQLSLAARYAQEAGIDIHVLDKMNKAEVGQFIEEHRREEPAT